MSTLSLEDRVKALNLGLTLQQEVATKRVSVVGGGQWFTFDSLEQASQALDLANYVAFNTLRKFGGGA